MFKLSNHLLIIPKQESDSFNQIILSIVHNRYLEHFLSYYNRKYEELFLTTESYEDYFKDKSSFPEKLNSINEVSNL